MALTSSHVRTYRSRPRLWAHWLLHITLQQYDLILEVGSPSSFNLGRTIWSCSWVLVSHSSCCNTLIWLWSRIARKASEIFTNTFMALKLMCVSQFSVVESIAQWTETMLSKTKTFEGSCWRCELNWESTVRALDSGCIRNRYAIAETRQPRDIFAFYQDQEGWAFHKHHCRPYILQQYDKKDHPNPK